MAKRKKKATTTLADKADRYALYERSVQAPDVDAGFAVDVFRSEFRKRPTRLREDFCGTAAVCCEWVKLHAGNRAWGVDLDPEPLDWGTRHNVQALAKRQQQRVRLIEGDVRMTATPSVDVVMAQNFSYFLFPDRPTLLRYFRSVRRQLDDHGIFILDMYGGPEALRAQIEETDYDDFTYCWDQDDFDPVTRQARCFIHFEFPDGSRLDEAFRYEWRMWTIPELREVLDDAGFTATEVWWEGTDPVTGEGDGEYTPVEHAEADDAWICYLVAIKR
jgi:SAM-dependent methyltransferase